MNTARLRELAQYVDPGPWTAGRGYDGAVMVFDSAGEPFAHVYAGSDAARWIAELSPRDVLDAPGGD